ncbi:MAG: dihydrofolate reductase [Bacteroidetes bacterium]|jgi:dihydrofolate reductase|nr:dihydrofolate reductase [Bacteroidota bacterium]
MRIILIAAVAKNLVIGNDGEIPWDLPEDRRRFRRLTQGHVVLMGRYTFRALGRPLPLRRNVVLTHHALQGIESYPTLDMALDRLFDEPTVYVIGGGEVYQQTIGVADAMRLTLLDEAHNGDVHFPAFEHEVGTVWKEVSREEGVGYAFVDYERIAPKGTGGGTPKKPS